MLLVHVPSDHDEVHDRKDSRVTEVGLLCCFKVWKESLYVWRRVEAWGQVSA